MSLEVRHLSYAFHGRDAPYLRDVSLTVGGGEIVVICGPSGGGKSTLIKCIDGIYPYVNGGKLEGDILVDGSLAGGQPPEARSALIGTVFQDFDAQIIHLTAEDELAFGPENLGIERSEIKRRVEKVSSIIRLDPGADPCTLSGGNKQRLCIGSTLAMETPVLLLDEPLSNLDIGGARSLMHSDNPERKRKDDPYRRAPAETWSGEHADRVCRWKAAAFEDSPRKLPDRGIAVWKRSRAAKAARVKRWYR